VPRTELIFWTVCFVGSDEDGGIQANIAASGASHQTERAQASEAIKVGRLGPCPGPSRR
jgi:hypothetical protein